MTEEDDKLHRGFNIGRFCEKEINSHKVRDHCDLAGKYRGPAHQSCKNIVTQKQSNFIPLVFHNFSKYDSHLISSELVYRKNDKVYLDIIPQTNEEYISVTYGCL